VFLRCGCKKSINLVPKANETFSISSTGIISHSGAPTFRGIMNNDKDMVFGTGTFCPGHEDDVCGYTLIIGKKTSDSSSPYIIQPSPGSNNGTDDGSEIAGKDAYTRQEGFEDTNYGDNYRILTGAQATGEDVRGLLQFNLDGLPGNAQSATLRLYSMVSNGFSDSGTVNVYRITESWDEMAVTHNTIPTSDVTIYASQTVNNVDGWVLWDITSLYNLWKSGTANYGMMLNTVGSAPCNGTGDCAPGTFYSSDHTESALRPMLVIQP